MTESIYRYVSKIKTGSGKTLGYQVTNYRSYYSERYAKNVEITPDDLPYDGATFAKDINSFAWLYHDVLKRDKKFTDGSECSNWKASVILRDILKADGRYVRAECWFIGTLVWGSIFK